MKRLLTVCLVLLPCLASPKAYAQQTMLPAAAPATSDSIMADYWAYVAVKTLQDGKIGISYIDGTHSGQPQPRTYDNVALALASLLPALMSPSNAEYNPFHVRLQENQTARIEFMNLLEKYQAELTALGQDVPTAEARLAAIQPISPPFPDVPKDHWAYHSVEMLRKLGIVRGEADGKFHG